MHSAQRNLKIRPKIDLRQAMAQVSENIATDLTFAELVKAYCAVKFDGADLRLRKWVEAFGPEAAWAITMSFPLFFVFQPCGIMPPIFADADS